MKFGRWLCTLLLCILLVATLSPFAHAETKLSRSGNRDGDKLSKEEIAALWHGYLIKHRTQTSYDAFLDEWGLAYYQNQDEGPMPMHWAMAAFWPKVWDDVYAEDPSICAPYAAGKLTDETQNAGLDYLNLARTIFGVPAVALDEKLCEAAQHKAVLEGAWDRQDHYLGIRDDMDEEFFNKADIEQSECLAYGSFSTTSHQYAIQDCLDDTGSASNLLGVGHRNILMDPMLTEIGFGACRGAYSYATDSASGFYTAIHGRHDGRFENYDFLAWPASGNFPTDMFSTGAPWSITLNSGQYEFKKEDVTVTLTRKSDGKVWSFDHTLGEANAYTDAKEAYISFNENSRRIVFHPGTNHIEEYDGVYTVRVTGIYQNNMPVEVEYQVDFFDLDDYGLHRYDAKKATVSPADCTYLGYSFNLCQDCGNIRIYDVIDQLPHELSEATCSQLATCKQCGVKTGGYKPHTWVDATCEKPQTCSVCGTTSGEARGHSMGTPELIRKPSCTQTGVSQAKCMRCDYVEVNENYFQAYGHYYMPDITAPTCTEKGYTVQKCYHCGDSYTVEYTEATGHTDANRDRKCDVCGQKTCTSHTETVANRVEPTCEKTGLTEGRICANCGESLKAQEVIPALGHRYGDWKVAEAPTAMEVGREERVCAGCGSKEQRELPRLEPEDTTSKPTTPSNEPTESTEGSTESSEAVTESTEGSTESSEVVTESTEGSTESSEEDTESPYETTGSSEQSTENSDEPTEDSEADAESGSKPETKYTGIIVGVVAVVLCAAAGFVLIWLKKKRLQQ